ncbi:GNAT family N-acetyltransferase [Ignatzschineria sp. LJL83]
MLIEQLQIIQNVQQRSVVVIDAKDVDISHLISEFLELFPKGICFSDEESLLANSKAIILPLNKTREYLGLTTEAVLLDIREGFPLDYFLSIAATIGAGGILVLFTQDVLGLKESERFHSEPIATPYFHQYLQAMLVRYAYFFKNGKVIAPTEIDELSIEIPKIIPERSKAQEHFLELDDSEQMVIKQDFLEKSAGIYTLFSARGSGKSWLGASMIEESPEAFVLTAPNQNAITQYLHIENLPFRAPDALFLSIAENDKQPQTLIIEEAAKMPLAHLERLCRRFQKVLMISSVENYEGTGQGLREKIGDLVLIDHSYQLHQLKRFSGKDALTKLCDALRFELKEVESKELLTDTAFLSEVESSLIGMNQVINLENNVENNWDGLETEIHGALDYELYCEFYNYENIHELRENLPKLVALYQLLNDTHYQTNIQDLRRLMDAPNQVFVLAYYQKRLIGAIWAMEEGGLSPALTEAVFNGVRRPKGNLVAQMLVGQSYFPEAMLQQSVRISRISVIEPLRRLGIGQRMVQFLESKVETLVDFISVSFGLTQNLLLFWESIGYQIAHLGFHLDKTTGLHSAVVLKSLEDENVQEWIQEAIQKFGADALLNLSHREYRAEITKILQEKAQEGILDVRDRAVIDAHHNEKRALHTVKNALLRGGIAEV